MERFAESKLMEWKDSEKRKPLVMLGVRQCGKTYLLKSFGEKHFAKTAVFDFQKDSTLRNLFWDLDPKRLISALSDRSGIDIDEDTLVIFDEVQMCGPALASLKYFCEDMPGYHIACAGSLLGYALKTGKFDDEETDSFPVGKVEFIRLWPMSFGEFILASLGRSTYDYLAELSPRDPIPEGLMEILGGLFKDYLVVGGMPEAVSAWLDTHSLTAVKRTQNEIIRGYKEDIGKHCREDYGKVIGVWESAAYQVAESTGRFILKKAGGNNATLSGSIGWLTAADMLHIAREVNDERIPQKPRGDMYMKLYYPDVGLLSCAAGLDRNTMYTGDPLTSDIRGGIAENFVMNELAAVLCTGAEEEGFFYWVNERGRAEVDFQLKILDRLVPIEVKSGKIGRMQSLGFYCSRYHPPCAFVISPKNNRIGSSEEYTFVPLYMVWRFKDYAEAAGLRTSYDDTAGGEHKR